MALCYVLGFCLICGSTLSVNASASAPVQSLYGGTLVYTNSVSHSTVFTFDSDSYNQISSISGTVVTPYDITSGTISGHINHYSNYDSANLTIANYGHTDTVSLSVGTSNNTNYLHLDFNVNTGFSIGANINANSYYEVLYYMDGFSNSSGQLWGLFFVDDVLGTTHTINVSKHNLVRGSDLIYNRMPQYFGTLSGSILAPTSATSTMTWNEHIIIYEVSQSVYDSFAGQSVSDSNTQHSIQQGNEIAQDSNDVQHDTNNKVTDFFSSFFDNLVHIFVPEDGFFSAWFNELNDFFSAKLGFLYAPFDFIISFFNGVLNTIGTQEHGFTIPALSWEGTEFCPEFHFSFDMFAEEFPQLQEAVYFFSDVVIILALMRGIRAKLDLVLGVHEE